MTESVCQSTTPNPTEQQNEVVNKYDRPLATIDYNPLLGYFKVEDGAPDITPKNQRDAAAMRKLFALQRLGLIRLMVTVCTLLENQPQGKQIDVQALDARLKALGIAPGDIFTHALSIPFATPDEPNTMTFDTAQEHALHQAVHEILFMGRIERDAKNIDFSWYAYRDGACERECKRRGIGRIGKQAFVEQDGFRWRTGNLPLPPTPALDACTSEQRRDIEDIVRKVYEDWNNKKCDAEGLYIHASHAVRTPSPQHAVFVTSDKNFKRFSNVLKKTNWERLQALGFPGHIMKPSEAVAYFLKVTGAPLPDSDKQ